MKALREKLVKPKMKYVKEKIGVFVGAWQGEVKGISCKIPNNDFMASWPN